MADALLKSKNAVRVAVEGCGHGTLNAIYSSIQQSCKINGWDGVDLLIIGGDFQAVRNSYDLNAMSVPMKYREIGDFHEYYSGQRTAPYLTIFVGGNHEASSHLWELYYGGWVAPNIYYMGAANVLRFGPLRIAALSGIWKGYNYKKPHYERLPYSQDDVKSIYHVREFDVRKLLQVATQVDIGISHDWPRAIEWDGDWKALFRKKDLFEADSRSGRLGSAAARYVMDRLRPPYWFSAHLHVNFSAVVKHNKPRENSTDAKGTENGTSNGNGTSPEPATAAPIRNMDEIDLGLDLEDEPAPAPSSNGPEIKAATNEDEIDLDLDEDEVSKEQPQVSEEVSQDLRAQLPASFSRPEKPQPPTKLPPPPGIKNQITKFLALDKCLANRKFLQILEIEPFADSSDPATPAAEAKTRPFQLEYDREWLAITRVFAPSVTVGGEPHATVAPDQGEAYYRSLIEKEEAWVEEHIVKKGKMQVPANFQPTAPTYDPAMGIRITESPREYTSPQTKEFCEMLEIPNPFDADESEREARLLAGPRPSERHSGGGGGWWGGSGRGGAGRGGGRGQGRGRGRGGGARGRRRGYGRGW